MINFLVTLISDLFLRSKTFIFGLEAIASLSELIWHGEEMGDRRRRARRSVIMHLQVIIRRLSHRLAVFLALSPFPFIRAAHRESRLRFSSLLQRSQLSAVLDGYFWPDPCAYHWVLRPSLGAGCRALNCLSAVEQLLSRPRIF